MDFTWKVALETNIEALVEDRENLYDEVERLNKFLTSADISIEDLDVTPKNMLHLFRLAQIVMRVTANALEETENALHQGEIRHASNEIETKRLRASLPGDLEEMNDELIEIERAREALQRDLELTEESLEQERMSSATLKLSLQEEQKKSKQQQDLNRRMEGELRDCKTQLETRRMLKKGSADELQDRSIVLKKNTEITRLTAEIQMISTDNASLASELEAVTQELEAAIGQLDKNSEEIDSLSGLLEGNDKRIDDLTADRDRLRINVEDLREHDEKCTIKNTQLLAKSERLYRESIIRVTELVESKGNLENSIDQQKQEIIKLKHRIATDQSADTKKDMLANVDAIKTLEHKLQATQQDLQLLSIDWDRLDKIVRTSELTRNTDEVRENSQNTKKMKATLETYKKLHQDDIAKLNGMAIQLSHNEKGIVDLQNKLTAFENASYGMAEASKEIKHLKLKLSIDEKNIQSLAAKVSDLEAQASDLAEENMVLREKLGMGFKSKIDTSNLKMANSIDIEKLSSLNSTLQAEIQTLEEERIQLKKKLRLVAMERGERAVHLGLKASDLAQVEDYADSLRFGEDPVKNTIGSNHIQVINHDTLDRLVLELERCHMDQDESMKRISVLEEDLRASIETKYYFESATLEIARQFVTKVSKGDLKVDATNGMAVLRLVEALETKYKPKLELLFSQDDHMSNLRNVLQKILSHAPAEVPQFVEAAKDELKLVESTLSKYLEEIQRVTNECSKMKVQIEERSKMRLPIPSSLANLTQEGMNSVIHQLIEALHHLEAKEQENIRLEGSIKGLNEQWEPALRQFRTLYSDSCKARKVYEITIQEYESKVQKLEGLKEFAEIKSLRLSEVLEKLVKSPHDISQALIECQRRLIVLEVNECALVRRYSASFQLEQFYQRDNIRLKGDFDLLEQNSKIAINRLLKNKRESQVKFDIVQKKLFDSVPKLEHNMLEVKLQNYIEKTKTLLECERDWIEKSIHRDTDSEKVEKLQSELSELNVTLSGCQLKLNKFEIKSSRTESGAAGNKSNEISHEVQIELLNLRVKFSEGKMKEAKDVNQSLQIVIKALEARNLVEREQMVIQQGEHMEFCNLYEGGATRETYEALQAQALTLENQIEKLTNEVVKCFIDITLDKSFSELSAAQSTDLFAAKISDEKEKNILRAAVQELQMTDDKNLAIGKLHNHILILEASELRANRKADDLKTKCLNLETSVLELESKIDQQDSITKVLKLQSNAKVATIQRIMVSMRLRLAGAVSIEKHERVCKIIRSLNTDREALIVKNQMLKIASRETEISLNNIRIELRHRDDLLSNSVDSLSSQERARVWHDKLIEGQKSLFRAKKDCQNATDLAQEFQAKYDRSNVRSEEMELYIVALELELDEQRMEWESQQEAIDRSLSEREEIYNSVISSEVTDVLPDRKLPIGQQLESAFRLLQDRAKQMKVLEIKLAEYHHQSAENNLIIKKNEGHILEKDNQLAKIQMELIHTSKIQDQKMFELRNGSGENVIDKARERETNALVFARQTVSSLQRQLTLKDDMVLKYRKMLQTIRNENALQKQADENILSDRNELINTLTKRQIERFTSDGTNTRRNVAEREVVPEFDLVENLEKKIGAKEIAIIQLEESLNKTKDELTVEKKAHQATVLLLNQNSIALENTVIPFLTQESRLNNIESEVENNRGFISRAPAKDISELCSRQEAEILKKDQKLRAFATVVQELKEKLVTATKSIAESNIHRSQSALNIAEESDFSNILTCKVVTLETKIKRITEKHDKAVEKLLALDRELGLISNDLVSRNKELNRKSKEIAKLQATKKELEEKLLNVPVNIAQQNLPTLPNRDVEMHSNDVSAMFESKYKRKIQLMKTRIDSLLAESEVSRSTIETQKTLVLKSEKEFLRIKAKLNTISQNVKSSNPLDLALIKDLKSEMQDFKLENERKLNILEKKYSLSVKAHKDIEAQGICLEIIEQFKIDSDEIERNDYLPIDTNATKILMDSNNLSYLSENKQLKKDLKIWQEKDKEFVAAMNITAKLEEENLKLHRQVKKDSVKVNGTTQKMNGLKIENSEMLKEIVELRKVIGGIGVTVGTSEKNDNLLKLEMIIAEKDKIIGHLQNPENDEQSNLLIQNKKLTRELEIWKLRASKLMQNVAKRSNENLDKKGLVDEGLYKQLQEQFEDLKFNYKESLKQNMAYEQHQKENE